MEPDQTAPIEAVFSESTLIVGKASKTFQQTTKADKFCCDRHIKGLVFILCSKTKQYDTFSLCRSF